MENDKAVLVDDILVTILTLCNIQSVLTLSEASRHFHSLAFSKHVWLVIVSDLHRRGFIYLPPGKSLEDYTTDDLVDLVKRMVLGPRSWRAQINSDVLFPIVAHQIILESFSSDAETSNWTLNEAQLIAGGKCLVYKHSGTLECLSMESRNRIWSYKSTWETQLSNVRYTVVRFAVETVDDGEGAILFIGVCDGGLAANTRAHLVEILHLNLITGLSTTLLTDNAPITSTLIIWLEFSIQGDYAFARLCSQDFVLLYRLSTGTKKKIKVPGHYAIDLVSGYLVLLTKKETLPPPQLVMKLWSMDALVELDDNASIDTVLHHLTTTILFPTCDIRGRLTLKLSTSSSPLREDLAVIWVDVSLWRPSVTRIYKYHLQHSRSRPTSMCCVASWELRLKGAFCYRSPKITYAGHIISPEGQLYSLCNSGKDCHLAMGAIPDPDEPSFYQRLSPYSSTLTYIQEHKIVVNYYE
ncbi:hypothetical protein Hypma_016569 [Hypsizygus marmoreus]|uniref:F-box domain-containing protein n=1 Tax=Hypsizygus marmoreus TaxID=39966 RepID=A0A369J535_HYPMA|nr:hypothetical protein Hypma_016569 [Hypsizygus marmoreus]